MGINVKPVFILSRGAGVFFEPDGHMEIVTDGDNNRNRINELLNEIKAEMGDWVTLLDEILVTDPTEFTPIFTEKNQIDVLLVYFLGVTPIEALLKWQGPIIAFSGQHTPAMALYALGDERRLRKDLFIALDYKEIKRTLKVFEIKKSLADTRVVLFGFPAAWHLRWYAFPDLEAVRRKTGLQFIPVELRELIEAVTAVDQDKAASLAQEWINGASQVDGPSTDELRQSAAACLAMDQILARKGARAMAINCLEITQSRKFSGQITNPCMGMSHLRDRGIPCGCEMDIAGLLTMILLGNLSRKPSFLGNIVRADPEKNLVKLSHCILPTRMPGFDKSPLPYQLRDFHGHTGVTGFTEVPTGVKVTLCRAQRNMERMVTLKGEVVGCEDTTQCRNTLTIQVQNVREFVRQAEGNHHIVVFGDYLEDLEALCSQLDCEFQSV